MTRKSEIRRMAGVVAMSAIGSVLAVAFAVGASALYSSKAWPQELAATAPVPQPRPRGEPEVTQVPINILCMDFDALEKELHKLGRFQVGGGIAGVNLVTLLYATPDMQEWTLITLNANNVGCVVITGNYWDMRHIEKRAA